MDGVVSELYDLIYPSPIPLEDLASIAVATQLWRSNLNKHLLSSDTLENVGSSNFISNQISHLSWMVKPKIEIHYNKLVSSMADWLRFHFEYIFKFHRDTVGDILNDFSDIVCDYDGSIHYVRTAERMLCCDRICRDEKFLIACVYSFEDSIREIWPFIEIRVILPDFDSYPHLYYWIHRLRNATGQIPNHDNVPVDDLMLSKTKCECQSSFEYFWNRASSESQYQTVVKMCKSTTSELEFCVRFLLLKLNEQQLTNFVNMDGANLMYRICMNSNKEYILEVWMYLKDRIDETNFIRFINEMLSENTCRLNYENSEICSEIWKSSANNLKQSATKLILSDQSLFKKLPKDLSKPREVGFLTSILKDLTLEQRGLFWRNNWSNLFVSTHLVDVQRIMQLCFQNETEVEEFKSKILTRYENLVEMAIKFFQKNCFGEWVNLLQFCCPDQSTNKHLKRQFLQDYFFAQHFQFRFRHIKNPKPMQEFIDSAYSDDFELASDFRYQLLSSYETLNFLIDYLLITWNVNRVEKFVESFALSNLKLEQWKGLFVDCVRSIAIRNCFWIIEDGTIQKFVLWCLGSHEELSKFKQRINPGSV